MEKHYKHGLASQVSLQKYSQLIFLNKLLMTTMKPVAFQHSALKLQRHYRGAAFKV